ncbi:MAG: hypothetical protein HY241_09965 [Actinobacteria bacterium]|nr:hypothetical protein [Actinomycetota bacterium]
MTTPPAGAAAPGLSALAAALHDVVVTSRRVRVPVEDLRRVALAADLSLAGSPDARARLADAIRELEASGAVTLPIKEALWERVPRPALPRWVARRAARPEAPAASAAASVSWHARLSWVPSFLANDRPSAAERSLLRAVNSFLGAGGSSFVVPLRERSLQLTGDEKALDTTSRGRLFATGRLSLRLLAARRTSPPMVRHRVGAGRVTLLVENYATYDSLSTALPAVGEVGEVVYSAGNTLGTVLTALADVGPPDALAYFGDLDVRGLEIAAAGARLATELGLPPLVPAERLYQLLLQHGRPAPTGPKPDAARARAASAWLPESLRVSVLDVLLAGNRLAQEAVGLELLHNEPPRTVRTQ